VFDPNIYDNGFGVPANSGWVDRGVAYWRNGDDERIIMLTAFAQMYALDAKTGKPVPGFGTNGRVDLAQGLRIPVDPVYYTMTSPPVIVRGVIVVGSSVFDFWGKRPPPPGDVRGFDVVTGRQLWTFHTVPQGEEPGIETWEQNSSKETGNANVWAPMSADEELGYVYLPVSTPSNDYYGGHRPGDGLYGESLVCIEAVTGKRVWHYQIVHHGLWDYDLPAAPNLIDITVDGRRIKAVAQPTKQAFLFVFDRVTGKPVWPIEEQPVPASAVPGEVASKTQPIPSKPAPFDLQGASDENLIDITPEIKKEAIEIASIFDRGGLYTPPSQRGTIVVPGNAGGASWSGAAVDPETNMLYVSTYRVPSLVKIDKPEPWQGTYDYIGNAQTWLPGPRELPLLNPPFGSIVAIDMNSGEHRWRIPVGRAGELPIFRKANVPVTDNMGLMARSWHQDHHDRRADGRAQPSALGRSLRAACPQALRPRPASVGVRQGDRRKARRHRLALQRDGGSHMAAGRQFIAFSVGGGGLPEELVAVALP
jgi:quinoprotein glucose dehydrogenase